MQLLREKDYRAWKTAHSIINRYGDVSPNDIPLEMLRKHARKRCRKAKEVGRVMEQIESIREGAGSMKVK